MCIITHVVVFRRNKYLRFPRKQILTFRVLFSAPPLAAITTTTTTVVISLCRVYASIISTDKKYGVHVERNPFRSRLSTYGDDGGGGVTWPVAARAAERKFLCTYVECVCVCVGPGQRTAFAAAVQG